MESPYYLKLSLGAAIALRFLPGRFYRDIKLYCVNLLLTYREGCKGRCAYCGLARDRMGDTFIRVEWPMYHFDEISERIYKYRDKFKRLCISMVTDKRAYDHTIFLLNRLKYVGLPISALITPTILRDGDIKELRDNGVDMIGIGLDAANKRIFEKRRGRWVRGPHSWEKYWNTIIKSREYFGEWRVGCHIIVGLGEKDYNLVNIFKTLNRMQVFSHLFSFYPEAGSIMERRRRPSVKRYRRVQLVRYMIEKGVIKGDEVEYDKNGMIAYINTDKESIRNLVESGLPFITSGCGSNNGELTCNRPFANSRPGEAFRNYPLYPLYEDIKRIKREMDLDSLIKEV
jgi:biotin synthase